MRISQRPHGYMLCNWTLRIWRGRESSSQLENVFSLLWPVFYNLREISQIWTGYRLLLQVPRPGLIINVIFCLFLLVRQNKTLKYITSGSVFIVFCLSDYLAMKTSWVQPCSCISYVNTYGKHKLVYKRVWKTCVHVSESILKGQSVKLLCPEVRAATGFY